MPAAGSGPQQPQDLTVNVQVAGSGPDQVKQMLVTLKELLVAEKEIKTQAQLVADAKAKQVAAAKAHAAEVKAAAQEEARARQAAEKGFANRGAQIGAALGGGPMGALQSGLIGGGYGQGIAAVIQGADKAIQGMARAAEIGSQAFATTAQKNRELADEFIPLAASLHRFGDAISGVTTRIEQAAVKHQSQMELIDARMRYAGRLRPVQAEQAALLARDRAAGQFRLGRLSRFDRSTLAGERSYQEQQITQPAADALVLAQRDAAASKEAAAAEARRRDAISSNIQELERRLYRQRKEEEQLRINENVSGVRNEAGRFAAGNAAAQTEKEIAAQSAALAEQAARAKEAGAKAAEDESRVRKAMIETQKAELAVLEHREQRMSSVAQRFGSMGRAGRMQALRDLRRAATNGIENMSPQAMANAAALAPDWMRQQQEQLGERLIRTQGRRALGDDIYNRVFDKDFAQNQTIRQLRMQMDQVKADIRVSINLDEQNTARALARNLEPMFRSLMQTFTVEASAAARRAADEAFRRSNNTQGASRK